MILIWGKRFKARIEPFLTQSPLFIQNTGISLPLPSPALESKYPSSNWYWWGSVTNTETDSRGLSRLGGKWWPCPDSSSVPPTAAIISLNTETEKQKQRWMRWPNACSAIRWTSGSSKSSVNCKSASQIQRAPPGAQQDQGHFFLGWPGLADRMTRTDWQKPVGRRGGLTASLNLGFPVCRWGLNLTHLFCPFQL